MVKDFKDLKIEKNKKHSNKNKSVYKYTFDDEPELPKTGSSENQSSKVDLLNDETFLNLIKKAYEEDIKNKYEYNKTWISVGDIVKTCPYPTIFRFLNNNYDMETLTYYPYTKLITSVGTKLHEEIQNMLSKIYDKVETEIKLEYQELNVKGFIDLKYEFDNTLVLGEIKTISMDELENKKFKGRDIHWKQITMYSYLYEKIYNRKPDFIQLIYVVRDFKPKKLEEKIEPFKIFTAMPDILYEEYLNDILENLSIIRYALKENKIPDNLPDDKIQKIKKAGECYFCPYKHQCPLFKHRKKVKEIKLMI